MTQVTNTTKPASAKQVALIWKLLKEKQVDLEGGATIESVESEAENLTGWEASQWIERLIALPNKPGVQNTNGRKPIPFKAAT